MQDYSATFDLELLDKSVTSDMIIGYLQMAGMGDAKLVASDEIRGRCIFHLGENPTSFVVKRDKSKDNKWFYLCNSCGVKGDLFNLLERLFDLSFGQVLDMLSDETGIEISREPIDPTTAKYLYETRKFLKHMKGNDELVVEAGFLETTLNKFVPKLHKLLRDKGYDEAVREKFELGFSPDWPLQNRITIPIRDEKGRLIGVSGRTVTNEIPKYKNLVGTTKKTVLYNLHNLPKIPSEPILVVEGFPDVWRAWQYGHNRAVAIMGCRAPAEQARLIAKYAHKVVVMLDGDEAGQGGADSLAKWLRKYCDVYVATLPEGKDPGDLNREEFWRVYNSAKKV